jgi:simple sugar transport system permease protein
MRIFFEKRQSVSQGAIILVPIVSFILALILGAILLISSGANPFVTYAAMFRGAFGSLYAFSETLVKAIPLMLTGLGVAIAFRMRFWNIGAEGQFVWGAIAASGVALFLSEYIPEYLLLPTVILAGIFAGALWAGIPAVLKAYVGVDETLTSLMLNYVAILFAQYLYYGPWRDPDGYGFPGTAKLPESAWLARLVDWFPWFEGRAHLGIIFAIFAAIALWFVFNRTRWGFELIIIGENKRAANYLGINIARNVVLAILLSGALSGLAGASEIAGVSRRLQTGLSMGYGYTAIIVAWMAQLNSIPILFVAILMGALLVGGDQVQLVMNLPASVGLVLQGLILFPMLAGSLFTEYRLRVVKKDLEGAVANNDSLTEIDAEMKP